MSLNYPTNTDQTIKAEYVSHMGSDLTVVNSARVSFNKESFLEDDLMQGRDKNLITYLAKHQHITPFTHPQITLRESIPIFVARQRFKHVVGFTYNEVSRRYVDDAPEFHVPTTWRGRPLGSVKQGSGDDHPENEYLKEIYSEFTKKAAFLYKTMLSAGVAPEQARMVLPQSMVTSFYVTGSLAAFARAYRQRIDPHAQKEIQFLAQQWDAIIRPLFPIAWAALTE